MTKYFGSNAIVTIGGKEIPILPDILWVDPLDEPFYRWWMSHFRVKRTILVDDLLDQETQRLLPDVDQKKKLEDEGTQCPTETSTSRGLPSP